MKTLTRRRFLKAATTAVGVPYFVPASVLGKEGRPAPSERVTLGCIGLGGRGTVDMQAFLGRADVQIVALCDVDSGSTRYEDEWLRGLGPALEAVRKHYAGRSGTFAGLQGYSDFRKLLARDDIDAVCIGTPDHWHAAMTVAAARAGKDIYCEKPLGLTVADGRAMVEAVKQHKRVFQCGSQRRSDARCRSACESVRNGRVGKLHTVRAGLPGGHWTRKNLQPTNDPQPVPEGFDYEMWLGPAPWAPYTYNRCHWNFRWNLDYSGGMVTDWGAHLIDVAHWGMGTEDTGPVEVEGKGTWPPRTDLFNTATAFEFTCKYANGVSLIARSGGPSRFEGTEGWIDLEGGKADPESLLTERSEPGQIQLYRSNDHHGNFIDCVKTRQETAAPVEVAHRSITPSHLGNIAMQLGRKLRWNPVSERFIDDAEADRHLARAYRAPWSLQSL